MAKRRVQLGATGENVSRNVAAVRRSQTENGPLTIRAMADRLSAAGVRTAHSAVSEIENGARRVDVDDLTALAAALGVSPLFLLLPHAWHEGDTVELTGAGEMPVGDAWAWMRDGVVDREFLRSKPTPTTSTPIEEHDDETGHRRDVMRALLGEPVGGAADDAAFDVAVVLYNRLLELGVIDKRVRFGQFRGYVEGMMRELATSEGIAERWGIEVDRGDD